MANEKSSMAPSYTQGKFVTTREDSIKICEPLAIEDYGLQAAAFVSPPKWHLAHTTWFFETFIIKPFSINYKVVNPLYEILFNSYYNGIGEQYPRPHRGLLSRPSLDEVLQYREIIDDEMALLLEDREHKQYEEIISRCELGIQHEKQHQELLLTDIKYSLSHNPLYPPYQHDTNNAFTTNSHLSWNSYEGGLIEIGQDYHSDTFCYDNECPKHHVFIQPYSLSNRLVTNEEFKAFIDDGGYQRPEYWLADGWAIVQKENWQRPLYWIERDNQLFEYTLYGLHTWQGDQPACHISGYEADAYASWAGARLPTEFEWEHAASQQALPIKKENHFHPRTTGNNNSTLSQLYDTCWQWTSSAYRPYPGFSASTGALGEYNGKFMCNQWVLRGGSCASPPQHIRASYRNFFYSQDRWQFSGLRLAKSTG